MSTEYRTWDEVRADRADLSEDGVAAARGRLLAERAVYQLARLRHETGLTQIDVASEMGVTQSRVSAIERGQIDHTELGTIRSYVEALGGRIRVVADFGDRMVDVA